MHIATGCISVLILLHASSTRYWYCYILVPGLLVLPVLVLPLLLLVLLVLATEADTSD